MWVWVRGACAFAHVCLCVRGCSELSAGGFSSRCAYLICYSTESNIIKARRCTSPPFNQLSAVNPCSLTGTNRKAARHGRGAGPHPWRGAQEAGGHPQQDSLVQLLVVSLCCVRRCSNRALEQICQHTYTLSYCWIPFGH